MFKDLGFFFLKIDIINKMCKLFRDQLTEYLLLCIENNVI